MVRMSEPAAEALIYKIASASAWGDAVAAGRFEGSDHDARDGFIHFSTAAQLAETAARHFTNQQRLVLIAVDARPLGAALRWEPSRGGDLFPHLYAALDPSAALWVRPLTLRSDGVPNIATALASTNARD